MTEVRDVVGLSEPLKRLIEVISQGVGAVSRPFLIRKTADARAYEIRTIAAAIVDAQQSLGTLTYKDGSIVIESSAGKEPHISSEPTVEQRTQARLAFQEAKRQLNLESIAQHAAEELGADDNVPSEQPDSDWVARFFRMAEDVTSEQMQLLWGKVLAGEVRQPGSYSLRTLELLKNISQREAQVFVRVGRLAVTYMGAAIVPNPKHGQYLKSAFGLEFTDFLLLREIGVLVADSDVSLVLQATAQPDVVVFVLGTTCVVAARPAGTPEMSVQSLVFTEVGRQLLGLVDQEPADMDYVRNLASYIRQPGVVIRCGEVVAWDGVRLEYRNAREIPPEEPERTN